jgi:prolyl-tRNA editing enzyme YbaK/EbsC (Cys-tRNA(Pro) deacylase)
MQLFDQIKGYLDESKISYKAVHHEPTRTSAESAAVRGEDLAIGGKAIVMKVDEDFYLFVLSAALKIDSKKVKEHFDAKAIRFADAGELEELTGLEPGAVPPFGPPILKLDIFVDQSILDNEKIAYNAGSLTDSIIMTTEDYLKIAKPVIFEFSRS